MNPESVKPNLSDERRWPNFDVMARELTGGSDVIVKAAVDPFDYACRLVTGDVVYFRQLEIRGEWLYLSDIHNDYGDERVFLRGREYERGMEVQRRHIVWIVDAPFGS